MLKLYPKILALVATYCTCTIVPLAACQNNPFYLPAHLDQQLSSKGPWALLKELKKECKILNRFPAPVRSGLTGPMSESQENIITMAQLSTKPSRKSIPTTQASPTLSNRDTSSDSCPLSPQEPSLQSPRLTPQGRLRYSPQAISTFRKELAVLRERMKKGTFNPKTDPFPRLPLKTIGLFTN